jgi:hypothetical protein
VLLVSWYLKRKKPMKKTSSLLILILSYLSCLHLSCLLFLATTSLMPPRSSKGSFSPPNDNATYKDLLLFEERLKINAASLQRRKSRYQRVLLYFSLGLLFTYLYLFAVFLLQLLLVIAFLLSEVLLPPSSSMLSIPYKFVLQRLLPDIYTSETEITLHPYVASGLLFVNVTTLVLFFASGMYSEKIAYANK